MPPKTKAPEAVAETAETATAFPTLLTADVPFVRPARPAKPVDARVEIAAKYVVANGVAVLDVSGMTDKAVASFGRQVGAALKTLAPGRRVIRMVGSIGSGEDVKPALKITLAPVKS